MSQVVCIYYISMSRCPKDYLIDFIGLKLAESFYNSTFSVHLAWFAHCSARSSGDKIFPRKHLAPSSLQRGASPDLGLPSTPHRTRLESPVDAASELSAGAEKSLARLGRRISDRFAGSFAGRLHRQMGLSDLESSRDGSGAYNCHRRANERSLVSALERGPSTLLFLLLFFLLLLYLRLLSTAWLVGWAPLWTPR